ncbi:MAG: MATE family efflux transporter [Limnochordia bacterium]|jgi:putative MATE family efflux protein|nr:MATE family efflux transporter [Bacillota bacterium]HOB09718.1 MATE family efflux transporter [Limnochordia bacterium]NLH32130.1 MATE family efflux transporter [Bacillota bacterium]HPT93818.1 MATE family efflux transporter [Limnochordia bacterium]HPZ31648.1 MATE family efflux transporter [Limnochordia bacterium]
MGRIIDLTEGSISKTLIRLALPTIATSFVQMAYSLTDMAWVGRLGAEAVAAVGIAGLFTWFAAAIIMIARIGAEVGVAQSIGRGDRREAQVYIRHSIQLIICLASLYALALIVFRNPLLAFFRVSQSVEEQASGYLLIVSLGMVFYTINPVFSAIFNGAGDSTSPFKVNVVGLILNMILDPILIYGVGPFPRLGTAGAAIATVIAQLSVTLVFCYHASHRAELFSGIRWLEKPDPAYLRRIVKMGIPVALQSALFTTIAMIISRIISQWGDTPIAVQKIGSQIESISWMTAGGFQTAMSAFVGQNFGAKKWDRVVKGYYIGLGLVSAIGVFATFLLIFAARPMFALFIPEPEAVSLGVGYLRILGVSQLAMCVEIVTAGAFIGHGRSFPPSIVGISFNLLRIPGALILSSFIGLDGVWWAITLSSLCKGSVLVLWHLYYLRTNPELAGWRRQAETVQ